MIRRIAVFLVIMMVLGTSVYASELYEDSDDVYLYKFLSFEVQNNKLYLEEGVFEIDHSPFMLENGMVMVPLRDIFDVLEKEKESYDLLSYKLIWNNTFKKIECSIGLTKVIIPIDNNNQFSLNGYDKNLEYPLINKHGTIYISLKDIAALLGNSFYQNFYDIANNRFGVYV